MEARCWIKIAIVEVSVPLKKAQNDRQENLRTIRNRVPAFMVYNDSILNEMR